MSYSIEYFHPRVKAEIESRPAGVLADYTRIEELLMEFGPQLRVPHSRPMGDGLFELRPRGSEVLEGYFIALLWINTSLFSMPSSRRLRKHQNEN